MAQRRRTGLFFELSDENGSRLDVLYRGVLPDNFKSGKKIAVVGQFGASGLLEAETLISSLSGAIPTSHNNYSAKLSSEGDAIRKQVPSSPGRVPP